MSLLIVEIIFLIDRFFNFFCEAISTSIRLTIFFFVRLTINIFACLTIIVFSLLKNIIASSGFLLSTIFLFFLYVSRVFIFLISLFIFKNFSLLLLLLCFNYFNFVFFFINYEARYSRIFKYNKVSRFAKLLLIFCILRSWILFFYNSRSLAINNALFSLFLYLLIFFFIR